MSELIMHFLSFRAIFTELTLLWKNNVKWSYLSFWLFVTYVTLCEFFLLLNKRSTSTLTCLALIFVTSVKGGIGSNHMSYEIQNRIVKYDVFLVMEGDRSIKFVQYHMATIWYYDIAINIINIDKNFVIKTLFYLY